jgi:hypothetical protein
MRRSPIEYFTTGDRPSRFGGASRHQDAPVEQQRGLVAAA